MAVQKRTHEDAGSRPTKKAKTEDALTKKPSAAPRPVFTSSLVADETDFPRGGGSSLTPFEYKGLREEGRREADAEIAEVIHLFGFTGICAEDLFRFRKRRRGRQLL